MKGNDQKLGRYEPSSPSTKELHVPAVEEEIFRSKLK